MLQSKKAFIGVSMDSKLFSREWVRYALRYVLDRHETLLFIIADDLYKYTRTISKITEKEYKVLDFLNISSTTMNKGTEIKKFILSEVNLLDKNEQNRIEIKLWRDFSDYQYIDILRKLEISFITISQFKKTILKTALAHKKISLHESDLQISIALNSSYLIDEIAMCIYLSEICKYTYEYYPANQTNALRKIYSNDYSKYGLTIKSLTGNESSRIFYSLKIPKVIIN